ncbi:MAG: amino acid ABC transporter permease [Burkholderiaceae bacterium]|jgi:general L-amino acid transport system permease protein
MFTFLSNPRLRALTWQVLLALALALGLWFIVANLNQNLAARGIAFGYDFLSGPSGFDISEQLIEYTADSSYWTAFAVGILNTLRVALVGILMATLIGLLIAVGALSINPLLRALCQSYVEFVRNVPLLLQLFFWYLTLAATLPPTDAPLAVLPEVYLSKNGLQFPWFLAGEFPTIEVPEMGPFGLVGGAALSPEFIALLLGLGIYTSAFIAEVIRAGILSVPKGQAEAAGSLGLTRWQTLRLVVLPQALRVIIPPTTNQYLNLTKNSSLAVAIGYPEVVSIATTTLNQSGRAVEAISILMLVYLTLSLLTSFLMHRFEAATRLRER